MPDPSHNHPALRDRRRALRHNATPAERRLWKQLRGCRLDGWRWCRQYSVGPYVLDFFCPKARLAVELDGGVHVDPARAPHDAEREAWLEGEGIRVLRFENHLIVEQVDLVVEAVREALRDGRG